MDSFVQTIQSLGAIYFIGTLLICLGLCFSHILFPQIEGLKKESALQRRIKTLLGIVP